MFRHHNIYTILCASTFSLAFFLTGCGEKHASPEPTPENTGQIESPPSGQTETPGINQKTEITPPPAPFTPAETESLAVLASADQELENALADFMKNFHDDPLLPNLEAPAKTVFYFVKALQLKNDKAILALLSTSAREERRKYQIPLGPDDCANMGVEFGNISPMMDEDGNEVGAQVGMLWTFGDPNSPETAGDQIVWIVRKENSGEWRIAGMVAVLDENLPPLPFNFENIEEMKYFLENADEEINRRLDEREAAQ